ncbi:NAD-dependent epimerase/dehydratase family protein, partial [Succinivibrio sp.]
MRILITGGTGLIGRSLCSLLLQKGHEIFVLSRNIIDAKNVLPSAIR